MKRALVILIIVFILILAVMASSVHASPNKYEDSKVVLFIIDNTSWDEWIEADSPFLNSLIRNSAIGLINNQADGMLSRSKGYLTIGGGARSAGLLDSALALNADETYENSYGKEVYTRRTGFLPGNNQVFSVGLYNAYRQNEKMYFNVIPGSLGQALSDNGKTTAIFGNSDISFDYKKEDLHREAACLAMDQKGAIKSGDMSKDILKEAPRSPYGIKTDQKKLLNKVVTSITKDDFIVIDYGDSVRADLYKDYVGDKSLNKLKLRSIREASSFLSKIYPQIEKSGATLIVASFLPPGTGNDVLQAEQEQLTPVLITGLGEEKGGRYLVSPGVHRQGLILNIDIAPTILERFSIKQPSNILGNPVDVEYGASNPETLRDFNNEAVIQKPTRRYAILSFIYFQVILFLAISALIISRKKIGVLAEKVLGALLLTSIAFPLCTYFTSKFLAFTSPLLITIASFIAAIAIGALLKIVFKKQVSLPVIIIAGFTVAVMILDVLLAKGSLQLGTVFGYDPIRGSRFYGIGNEAMSVFLASALLFTGVSADYFKMKKPAIFQGIIFLVIILIIGLPKFGADVGGTIASVAAFAFVIFHTTGIKTRWQWVIVTGAIVGSLVAFIGYDFLNGSTSHLGKAMGLIFTNGGSEALMIIKRKLATNIKVLRYSTWSYFLLGVFVMVTVLKQRPIGLFRTVLDENKYLAGSITGAIIGGLFGLVFNDSGIVIPAIIFSYFFPVILLLMMDKRSSEAI